MSLSRRLSKETITYAARALQLEGACLCRHRTSSTARRRGRGEVRWAGCPLLVRKRAGVCACLRGHAHLDVLPRAQSKGSQPRHCWHWEPGGPLLWGGPGRRSDPWLLPARCPLCGSFSSHSRSCLQTLPTAPGQIAPAGSRQRRPPLESTAQPETVAASEGESRRVMGKRGGSCLNIKL